MKRSVRLLVRLYPSSWRKRYGAEFEALLEDATPSAYDAFDIVLGALKMRMANGVFIKIMLAGLAVGIAVATLVFVAAPKHYRSEAFFTVTPSNQFTANVLEALQKKPFFNKASLTSLIQERNLYSSERNQLPMDAVINEMKRNIHVYSVPTVPPGKPAEVKFVVQFEYSDPKVAQQVNEGLVSQFMRGIVDSALIDPHPGTAFQILDPPTLPLNPIEPNFARSSAIGLLSGLVTGLALAILAKLHRPPTPIANG